MAGVYGPLSSRDDFLRALDAALAFVREGHAGPPEDPGVHVVQAQLEAMHGWTYGGRDPRPAERGRISLGVIASREFEGGTDPAVEAWRQSLFSLYSFFQGWPTDHQASTATDEDALRLFDVADANRAAAKKEHER